MTVWTYTFFKWQPILPTYLVIGNQQTCYIEFRDNKIVAAKLPSLVYEFVVHVILNITDSGKHSKFKSFQSTQSSDLVGYVPGSNLIKALAFEKECCVCRSSTYSHSS